MARTRNILRIIAALALAIAMLALSVSSAFAATGDADRQATNRQLVLLVRFAGDTTGDNSDGYNAAYMSGTSSLYRTEWEYFLDTLNRPATKYWTPSLYAYVEEISNGQHTVVTDAPQTNDDGTVSYLTMPHVRSYYTSQDLLMRDAADAFSKAYPSYKAVKLNSAGCYDNILLVPEVGEDAPATSSDPLWSRALYYTLSASTKVGDGKVGSYTLVTTANASNIFTVCHEYLHTLGPEGIRDLYRMDQQNDYATGTATSNPVGIWDIMAQGSGTKLNWPLAVTRENIGWTAIDEVKAGGTYTLGKAYSGTSKQAIKVRTGRSSSEYFVIEYRQSNKGAYDYSLLDRGIESSGIIVYRVNEAYKDSGNKGDGDYIYVFRPEETGFNAGNGKLSSATLSMSRSTLGIGDKDMSSPSEAIYYSDGSNSGITVRVTGETDSTVTFELGIPQSDSDDWADLLSADGSNLPASLAANAVELTSDGSSAYLLVESYEDGINATKVLKFDGGSWSVMSSLPNGMYSGFGRIACGGGRLVIAGMNASGVVAYEWSGSAWGKLDTSAVPTNANDIKLTQSGGSIYLSGSFGDYSFTSDALSARAFKLADNSFAAVGGSNVVGRSIAGTTVFEQAGKTYLVAGDSVRKTTGVYVLSNGSWSFVSSVASYGADEVTVTSSSGVAYALANSSQESTQILLAVDRDGVVSTQVIDCIGQCGCGTFVSSQGSTLYISATSSTSNASATVVFERGAAGDTWKKVGRTVTSSANDGSAVVVLDGKLVVATAFNTARVQYLERDVTPSEEDVPASSDTPATEPSAEEDAQAAVAAIQAAVALAGEEGVSGTHFGMLKAKAKKVKKTSVKIVWSKVKGASAYMVFYAKCGKANKYSLLKATKSTSLTKSRLKKGTYYKFVVVAVDGSFNKLAASKTIHVATKGGKYTNAAAVKVAGKSVKSGKIALKKGKKTTLKVSVKLPSSAKSKTHRRICFESSDSSVATVSAKGVVTAKKRGTCYIYVFAQNGVYARMKLIVR